MTLFERRTSTKAGLATCAAFAAFMLAVGSPSVHAEPAPVASGAKSAPPAAKASGANAGPAQAAKPAAAKGKGRLRALPKAAKTPAAAAAKPTPAPAAKTPADSPAKPTQVMDFDNDEVEGKRLEPGFELIQAAPRRARQPSLVTPLRPEDSVVRRE